MGLFDFVKSAGAKIFGTEEAAPPEPSKSTEEIEREADAAMAKKLIDHVRDHALEVSDFRIDFKKGLATLRGTTTTQSDREKVILIVGNVTGVSQVDDRLDVDAPEPEAVFYTVERGDTLSKIAKEQYGNDMKYPVIFEANRPMLKDPDRIYPGQVLRIPPLE